MLRPVKRAWTWLVDGTAEAAAWCLDRARGRVRIEAVLTEDGTVLRTRRGAALGRLVPSGDGFVVDPPAAIARLAGASVVLTCPPNWLFRRKLDPVAVQGAPFLDAFVRHQIDRLTPWRADDLDICVVRTPLAGDASRLAVEVGVVPKRLTAAAFQALRSARPARMTLAVHAQGDGQRFTMAIEDRAAERLRRLRGPVAAALLVYLCAWPVALAWVWWSTAAVEDEIAAADEVIDARKAVLAAAARHRDAGQGLAGLRAERPRVVDLIDALSAALPDTAYATDIAIDGPAIKLSGISTDTSRLVPALESSGRFVDVTFFDSTTRMEGATTADRFHLSMQAKSPPRAPTPP